MPDTKHEGETFGPEPLLADGRIFVRCTFNGTRLIIAGDGDFSFFDCTLNEVKFEFTGAAGRTLGVLKMLYATGPAGRALVDGIVARVRTVPSGPVVGGGSWQA